MLGIARNSWERQWWRAVDSPLFLGSSALQNVLQFTQLRPQMCQSVTTCAFRAAQLSTSVSRVPDSNHVINHLTCPFTWLPAGPPLHRCLLHVHADGEARRGDHRRCRCCRGPVPRCPGGRGSPPGMLFAGVLDEVPRPQVCCCQYDYSNTVADVACSGTRVPPRSPRPRCSCAPTSTPRR